MENIKMSYVSLSRILRVACRAGDIDEYERNTLRYLLKQCTEEEKEFLVGRYSSELPFLKEDWKIQG